MSFPLCERCSRDLTPVQILEFADADDITTRIHLLRATVLLLDSAGPAELAHGRFKAMVEQIHGLAGWLLETGTDATKRNRGR